MPDATTPAQALAIAKKKLELAMKKLEEATTQDEIDHWRTRVRGYQERLQRDGTDSQARTTAPSSRSIAFSGARAYPAVAPPTVPRPASSSRPPVTPRAVALPHTANAPSRPTVSSSGYPDVTPARSAATTSPYSCSPSTSCGVSGLCKAFNKIVVVDEGAEFDRLVDSVFLDMDTLFPGPYAVPASNATFFGTAACGIIKSRSGPRSVAGIIEVARRRGNVLPNAVGVLRRADYGVLVDRGSVFKGESFLMLILNTDVVGVLRAIMTKKDAVNAALEVGTYLPDIVLNSPINLPEEIKELWRKMPPGGVSAATAFKMLAMYLKADAEGWFDLSP
jgi:hypothetical protein